MQAIIPESGLSSLAEDLHQTRLCLERAAVRIRHLLGIPSLSEDRLETHGLPDLPSVPVSPSDSKLALEPFQTDGRACEQTRER